MACGMAKAAVVVSYAGSVASVVVGLGSAGTLTVGAAAAFVLSFAGLITALNELGTCLEQQGRLDEAQKVREQIETLTREKERLEQLLQH